MLEVISDVKKHTEVGLESRGGIDKSPGICIGIIIDAGLQAHRHGDVIREPHECPGFNAKRHGLNLIQAIMGKGVIGGHLWFEPKVFFKNTEEILVDQHRTPYLADARSIFVKAVIHDGTQLDAEVVFCSQAKLKGDRNGVDLEGFDGVIRLCQKSGQHADVSRVESRFLSQ